jgi:hypothetical protein
MDLLEERELVNLLLKDLNEDQGNSTGLELLEKLENEH